jgi:type II secretory pathway pseudopilin PulG
MFKNMKNTKYGIIMIASIMVIVGTTLTPTLQQQVNAALKSQHIDQENLCFRSNTCRQSDVGQNTLGNDNSVTGFADQSDNPPQTQTPTPTVVPTPTPTVIPTPTPTATPTPTPTPTATPTPTPIPMACPTGTVFDVTLQVALCTFPAGTDLCLNTAGLNMGITAILPPGNSILVNIIVAPQVGSTCPAGSVAAAVTSGSLPAGLSGLTLCVGGALG